MSTPSLDNLIDKFASLPSIGRKTATRLAFYILERDGEYAIDFAQKIVDAKNNVHWCKVCCDLTDDEECMICNSSKRDKTKICVVETPQDVIAMEKTHEYKGLYHVLHGVISPMDGISADDIKIKELLVRLEGVGEVIMATNPTIEGETTAIYIAKLLKELGLQVTRIASGVPIGASLEFADKLTLSRAMENRRRL